MGNLEEMDKFLETYKLPTETGRNRKFEQTHNQQRNQISNQKSPKKQESRAGWLSKEILSSFKEELTPIMLKLHQKIEIQGKLPNSFYEASITLIPKPEKDHIKKENYRPISLNNVDANILNKIPANQIQQYIKRIIQKLSHKQVGFIPGCRAGSVSTKQQCDSSHQ